MGSRTLALGLQFFGVIAVTVTAAVLAPLLLTGPHGPNGLAASPPLSSTEVARVLGVEPSSRPGPVDPGPAHRPPEGLVAVGEPVIPAAREALGSEPDSGPKRAVRRADLVRLPRPADQPQRWTPPGHMKSSSSTTWQARGSKVKAHSANGHAHAYGHGKRPAKGKKRR